MSELLDAISTRRSKAARRFLVERRSDPSPLFASGGLGKRSEGSPTDPLVAPALNAESLDPSDTLWETVAPTVEVDLAFRAADDAAMRLGRSGIQLRMRLSEGIFR